jgi:Tfp pilus assembly protein PilV
MMKSEKGISLIETIVAVVILGIIAVAFLSALATTSAARATNDPGKYKIRKLYYFLYPHHSR